MLDLRQEEFMGETDLVEGVQERLVGAAEWRVVLSRISSLSERELQVFRLLAEGRSNRKISARLWVTERTVKSHVAQILAKLDVESRLQAGLVAFAWMVLDRNGEHLTLPNAPGQVGLVTIVADMACFRPSRHAEQA
jgi:DNA-binding CsgD family transcriptional regulator